MNFQDFKKKILERIKVEKEQKVLQKEREKFHKKVLSEEKAHKKEEHIDDSNAFISLKHINKIYDNHVQAVFDFNLNISSHEFIVLVGPSGCGKSTTLRMIAGLEEITSGDLFIDGVYANELPPKDRNIGMVFQSYALYPHMTVYENMAFGLKVNHVKKDEIEKRVLKAAEILQITEYLNRKPSALSGGQCQRVALGRAIVRDAKVFLMDEPLSNLDAKLRVQMRSEIVKLHKALNTTTIYVTHDQIEAMTMASRIVVMNKGYIQQIGTPEEIYSHPINTFVATFIGSPAMNITKVKLDENKLIFNNGLTLFLKEDFSNILKDFYNKEIEKELAKVENYKNLYFERFINSRSFKKLKENISSFNEVKEEALKVGLDEKIINESNIDLLNNKIHIDFIKKQIKSLTKDLEKYSELISKTLQNLTFFEVNENKYEELNKVYLTFIKEFLYLSNSEENIDLQKLNKLIKDLKKAKENKTEEVLFGIRPEDIDLGENDESFKVNIEVRELLGSEYYIHFNLNNQDFISKIEANIPLKEGDVVSMHFNKDKIHIFDLLTEERIF